MNPAQIADICPCTHAWGAPLSHRLSALVQAGFCAVTLDVADLVTHPDGLDQALALVRASGLRVAALGTLRSFEGLDGALHDYKRGVAQSMLQLCAQLGCHTLLVQTSTWPHAATDTTTLVAHWRELATLAVPLRIQLAVRPHLRAQTLRFALQTWELLCEADRANLGLCLDVADWHQGGASLDDLELLGMDRLYWVHLADTLAPHLPEGRVFPGEGADSAQTAAHVAALHALGYRGPYGLAAPCTDDGALPLANSLARARRSAVWLSQTVLQRSVPLPNQMRLR